MRARFLMSCVVIAGAMAAQGASAADVYDEVTLSQLEQVLSEKFTVTRDKGDGNPLLLVEGRHNLVGVSATHCGTSPTCEGFDVWGVLSIKYSLSQANEFNRTHDYAKILVSATDKPSIWQQTMTVGGVTAANIQNVVAILMLREDQANQSNVASAMTPAQTESMGSSIENGNQMLSTRSYVGKSRVSFEGRNAIVEARREAAH